MTEKSFVHLHNHSEFSFIDGSSLLDSMASICNNLGMPAIALTDHGNMYGAIDFYNACKTKNIKPIIGCELNICENHLDKSNSYCKKQPWLLKFNKVGLKR